MYVNILHDTLFLHLFRFILLRDRVHIELFSKIKREKALTNNPLSHKDFPTKYLPVTFIKLPFFLQELQFSRKKHRILTCLQ